MVKFVAEEYQPFDLFLWSLNWISLHGQRCDAMRSRNSCLSMMKFDPSAVFLSVVVPLGFSPLNAVC